MIFCENNILINYWGLLQWHGKWCVHTHLLMWQTSTWIVVYHCHRLTNKRKQIALTVHVVAETKPAIRELILCITWPYDGRSYVINMVWFGLVWFGFRRSKGNPSFVSPPLMKCTDHMCPININWQIMLPKKEGPDWSVKVSITNFNYRLNYSDWTLLVNHPYINKLTKVFQARHKKLPNTSECVYK